MKKIEFYTLINNFGKPAAVLVKGYTDGTYNYYKDKFGIWHAVVPNIGLAFNGYYKTRKECIKNAYSEDSINILNKYYKNDLDFYIDRFEKLIEKAMFEKQ